MKAGAPAHKVDTPGPTPTGFDPAGSNVNPNALYIDDELDKRVRRAVEKSEQMINKSPSRYKNDILDNCIQTYLKKDPLPQQQPLLYTLSPHLTMETRLVPTLRVYSQDNNANVSTSQYNVADVSQNLWGSADMSHIPRDTYSRDPFYDHTPGANHQHAGNNPNLAASYGASQYNGGNLGASQYNDGNYGQSHYGQDNYSASHYGQDNYGASHHGQDNYGASHHNQDNYGAPHHGQDNYDASHHHNDNHGAAHHNEGDYGGNYRAETFGAASYGGNNQNYGAGAGASANHEPGHYTANNYGGTMYDTSAQNPNYSGLSHGDGPSKILFY